jgi:hypothetical protein
MGAKVYADYLNREGGSSSPDPELDHDGGGPRPPPNPPDLPLDEVSEETEVQAVAAWFEALPDEWRSYFDREAESGQRAYGQA